MVLTSQQRQAREYFDKAADDWRRKAEETDSFSVGVIRQRNECVLRASRRVPTGGCFMDIGCGTGELTLEMASRNFDSIGLDFAPGMIELCQRKAASTSNAQFVQASFFDFPTKRNSFDILSAQGFIEYISAEELKEFLTKTFMMLRPGGLLVLGSRNRLFNLFSLSAYTELELKLGVVSDLLQEALALATAANHLAAIAELRNLCKAYPLVSSHPITGIGVDTRHQYSPSELIRLSESVGYCIEAITPVHYHAFCVPFSQSRKDLYVPLSEAIYAEAPEDHRLVPYSSTFVITALKPFR